MQFFCILLQFDYNVPIFLKEGKMLYYILFNLALVILGCFLTWLHPGLFVAGHRGIQTFDGKIILGLALIGFLHVSFQMIWRKKGYSWINGLVGFFIFIVSVLVLYDYIRNQYPIGPGIYLAALGGLQLTGAYVVMLFQRGRGAPPP